MDIGFFDKKNWCNTRCNKLYHWFLDRLNGKTTSKAMMKSEPQKLKEEILFLMIERYPAKPLNSLMKKLCRGHIILPISLRNQYRK